MAFRSVPRPSSPPGAKASTECPSLALFTPAARSRFEPPPSCTGAIQPSSLSAENPIQMPPNRPAATTAEPRMDAPSQAHINDQHPKRAAPRQHPPSQGPIALSRFLNALGCGDLDQRSSSGQTCNRRTQMRQTLIHLSKEQSPNPILPQENKTRAIRARPAQPPFQESRSRPT
jgi:hypothetical protein